MLFTPDQLTERAAGVLRSVGTPGEIAARVAAILVNADLVGHSSHGVARLPSYLEEVSQGKVAPAERPKTIRETAATAALDARRGWGHFAADTAMRMAIAKAKSTGVGVVSIVRCPHVGRLGEYAEMATREGCIGLVTLGFGGRDLGWTAPYGGRSKMLMTNPIAIGVPVEGAAPFLLDFATTTASRGKVSEARRHGRPVPEGWILDSQGRPSTRPEDFFDGGFLSLMGQHKGYALNLATCLLGALSGGFQAEHARMGGVYVQAVDVGAFQAPEVFGRNNRAFLDGIRASEPVDPSRPVLVPGDLEAASREQIAAQGIEVTPKLLEFFDNVVAREPASVATV